MSLRIEIISDIFDNQARLAEIESTFHSIPFPFQSSNILNWWRLYGQTQNYRFGGKKRPIIVFLYKEKQLRAVFPLLLTQRIRKRFVKLNILEFFSQSFCGDFLDLIHNQLRGQEVNEFLFLLKKELKFDYMHLNYLPENSILLNSIVGQDYIHAGKVVIPIDNTYEEIRKSIYSRNLRHILNKSIRRIEESGQNIKAYVLEGAENIYPFKEKIKTVSLSKLKDKGMHSVYVNEEIGDNYFESMMKTEKPFCSVYILGDELMAYNIGYIQGRTVYAFDAAYNRNYAESQKIGLGILAYDRIVEHFATKYDYVDMGFGLDDYKFRFSKKTIFTRSLIVKGNTLKSILIFTLFKNKLIHVDARVLQKYSESK